MKLLITILFTLFSAVVGAAVPDLEVDFSTLSHTSNYDLLDGNTIWCPGWSFNTCYSAPASDGTLLVGKTDEPGQFTTQNLPLNGNASVIFEVKKSGSATITASITGGGSLLTGASKTIDKDCNVVFYVKDGTPSTRLTITGTAGKFHVKNMRVYNIGDAVFYESFDHMDGRNKEYEFYSSNKDATSAMCDNSENTSIVGIRSSYRSIYLEDSSSEYQILRAPVEENSIVLLSFQIGYPSFMNNQRLTLSCSSDAYVTQLNSTDQNTLFTSVEKTQFSDPYRNWYDYFVIVCGMSSSTTLTFKATDICLNNVMLTPIPSKLDQSSCNATYIKANADQTRNVQLIRTLTPNIWCPLCLPFDVTKEKMEDATRTTCELCILNSIDNGVFKFEIVTSTIPAGTPFLVRVNKTVTNPEFTGVTIVNTPAATATASTDDYKFVGTYSPIDLETDGSNLFLATDGELYTPESAPNNRLGGLRAYFVVPPTANTARVMIPETTSNISSSWEVSPSECYELFDLRGQRTNNPNAKGLYIHGGKKILIP